MHKFNSNTHAKSKNIELKPSTRGLWLSWLMLGCCFVAGLIWASHVFANTLAYAGPFIGN